VPNDVNKLEEDLLALDIEDFDQADNMCRVITSREAFIIVRKSLDGL
jgi:hypothetical protein